MVDTTQSTKGDWLKANIIESCGNVAEFSAEGVYVESQFDKSKEVLQTKIKFPNGEEYDWTPNATTIGAFQDEYGMDSKGWVGKKVVLRVEPRTIKGVVRSAIFGDPFDKKPQAKLFPTDGEMDGEALFNSMPESMQKELTGNIERLSDETIVSVLMSNEVIGGEVKATQDQAAAIIAYLREKQPSEPESEEPKKE